MSMHKHLYRILLLSIFCSKLLFAVPITTQNILYLDGATLLEGYFAYPTVLPNGKVPGVLLVHAWDGVGANEKNRAEEIARWGYAVFAIDMYGYGIRPQTIEESGRLSGMYKADRPLMRARAKVGLDFMSNLPQVSSNAIVAAGFCFGGGVALELARTGAPIVGVASFHGDLNTPTTGNVWIKGPVLVLHGADDPFVTEAQVAAFRTEMKSQKNDWKLIYIGNAVHAFTDPSAGDDPTSGAAYNADGSYFSMSMFRGFLNFTVGRK